MNINMNSPETRDYFFGAGSNRESLDPLVQVATINHHDDLRLTGTCGSVCAVRDYEKLLSVRAAKIFRVVCVERILQTTLSLTRDHAKRMLLALFIV